MDSLCVPRCGWRVLREGVRETESEANRVVWTPPQGLHLMLLPDVYGILPGSSEYLAQAEDVRKEAVMLSLCHDANILTFKGMCVDAARVPKYILTELATGGNLRGYLTSLGRPLTPPELVTFTRHILRGLQYMHHSLRTPAVHRDLKPENVLVCIVDGAPIAKLGDVGMSRFLDRLSAGWGTNFYAAPEILAVGPGPTTKADMFSFGIMMSEVVYAFMMGREVRPGERSQLPAILAGAAEYLRDLCAPLATLLQRCCEGDPDARPSAIEALAALEGVAFPPPRTLTPVALLDALIAHGVAPEVQEQVASFIVGMETVSVSEAVTLLRSVGLAPSLVARIVAVCAPSFSSRRCVCVALPSRCARGCTLCVCVG